MAADQYRQAEDQYFKLRGQFDTGRLTQEQFDEKLRELMIHDAQGRYWMLGADSGKWYYYDGAKWVQGEPYVGAAAASVAAPIVAPPSTSPDMAPPLTPLTANPPVSTAYTTAPARGGLPIVPIIIGVALIALAIIGFLVFQNRDRIFVAQRPPQVTPILPPTITRAPSPTAGVVVPTNAATVPPVPTAVPTDVPPPTEAPTQPAPTDVPATPEPAVTIVVVTAEPSPTVPLPTLLPTVVVPPTAIPTAKPPTAIPPTATNVPPTNTPVPNCPSGVCVTKITYSPAAPKRNQDVTFTASFVNSTGGAQNYNFLILLYDPNKPGNNKGFGESQAVPISVPPGEKDFSVTYTPVNGPGGCINLYMRAGWKISPFDKPIFPNVSGDPVQVSFDVCP